MADGKVVTYYGHSGSLFQENGAFILEQVC
jgi:hypothetical protein